VNQWIVTVFVMVLALIAPATLCAEDTNTPSAESAVSTGAALQGPLTRDPFWPIGWLPPRVDPTKAEVTPPGEVTHWDEARKLLQVTGMSRGKDGKYLAILKGVGVVEEGNTVSINYMGQAYKWKIKSITSKGIVPEKAGVYPIR
jgi:hypothetical protein